MATSAADEIEVLVEPDAQQEGVPPPTTVIDQTNVMRETSRGLLQAPAQDMSRGGTAEWTLHIKHITESWAVIVAPGDHAMVLRDAVFSVSGAEPDTQRLYFSTTPSSESDGIGEVVLGYTDPRTLREYGLEDGMTLHLALQSKAAAAAVKVEEETVRQARLKVEGEREAKARAEAQEREQREQQLVTWRPRIWIGAIVVWQAGLWTQEPVVVLSAAGIAIALLLLGWCASGWSVAEHEKGFCLWDCGDSPYDDQDMDEDFFYFGYARACMLATMVLGHLVATVISVAECGGIGDHQSVLALEEPFLQCGAAALWGIAPIAVFIMWVGLYFVTCPCWIICALCDEINGD
jgi:hypothetical protein